MDNFLSQLAESLVTIGPVGAFCLAAFYLWLRFGRKEQPVAVLARDREEERQRHIAPTSDILETRDMIRDTDTRTIRIEKNTEQEIEHLSTLVNAMARLAEVMGRLEKHQVAHDRWERDRVQRANRLTRRRR